MSIRFPDFNSVGTPNIIDFPTGTFPRYSTSTDFIFGMWVRPGTWHPDTNADHLITFGGASAGSRNVAITIQFNPAWGNGLLSAWACNNGTNYMQGISNQFPVVNYPRPVPFLVGFIHANSKLHFYYCPVGGTAVIVPSTVSSSGFHHTDPLFSRIASNNAGTLGFPGSVEHAFQIRGTVPLDGDNVPVLPHLTDLANGTLTFDGLIALMTNSPQKVTYYPLTSPADIANAWQGVSGSSGVGNCIPQNNDTSLQRIMVQGPTLRPNGLAPKPTTDIVSSVTGANPTTGTVHIPGGTYNATILGATPASIEARLLDEAGAQVKNWQVIDAAPSAGTFTGGSFTAVPVAATWYQAEYRVKDSGGNVLATSQDGSLRGLGTCIITGGQSQMEVAIASSGNSLTLTTAPVTRALFTSTRPGKITGSDRWVVSLWTPNGQTMSGITNKPRDGYRAFVREINAKRPGLPVQFIDLSLTGSDLSAHVAVPSGYEEMRQLMADAIGVPFNYYLILYGHSNESDPVAYANNMTAYLNVNEARFGPATKALASLIQRCPSQANTVQQEKRKAQHDWISGDTTKRAWGGNFNSVYTSDGVHPSAGTRSDQRVGTILAWAVMMAAGAVSDKPIKLTSAVKAGTTCVLTFGEATW